jgi:ribonuclease BN (tRNA processing enzyme)
LLGTGGPRPDPGRHGPATLLQIGDDYLLFDAGRGVVLQLVRASVPLDRINPVFLTHHHYDHIGDLSDVILTSWLEGRQHTLQVFGPPDTTSIVAALLDRVYDKDIEFRAKGEPALGGWKPVETTDVMRGLVCDGRTWQVFAEVAVHGHGLTLPDAFKHRWVCLGYRVEAEGKVIAISGDGVASAGLDRLARDADVLVQCCYLARAEITTPVLEHLAKHTLACADSVGKIAAKAGVKKLVLTHFRQKSVAVLREVAADVARDYDGPVVLGEDLVEVVV